MQARYYDPVLGRFLSNDPVGFAEGGPAYFNRYMYTANDPVNAIDLTGEEIVIVGSPEFEQAVRQSLDEIRSRPFGASLVEKLENSDNVIFIGETFGDSGAIATDDVAASDGTGSGTTIFFDRFSRTRDGQPGFVVLGHELGHADENDDGTAQSKEQRENSRQLVPTPKHEEHAVAVENAIRGEHDLPQRQCYNEWHQDC